MQKMPKPVRGGVDEGCHAWQDVGTSDACVQVQVECGELSVEAGPAPKIHPSIHPWMRMDSDGFEGMPEINFLSITSVYTNFLTVNNFLSKKKKKILIGVRTPDVQCVLLHLFFSFFLFFLQQALLFAQAAAHCPCISYLPT